MDKLSFSGMINALNFENRHLICDLNHNDSVTGCPVYRIINRARVVNNNLNNDRYSIKYSGKVAENQIYLNREQLVTFLNVVSKDDVKYSLAEITPLELVITNNN